MKYKVGDYVEVIVEARGYIDCTVSACTIIFGVINKIYRGSSKYRYIIESLYPNNSTYIANKNHITRKLTDDEKMVMSI